AGPGAELLLLFMIAGMTAGVVASSAPYTIVSAGFNAAALAPLAFVFATGSQTIEWAMAAVVGLYFAMSLRLALNAQQTLIEGVGLRFANDQLYASLREQARISRPRELLFRNLVESAGDLTFVFSYDGEIKYASPAAADLLGADADKIATQNISRFIHDDDFEALRKVAKQTLLHARSCLPVYHTRMRNRDGGWTILTGNLTNLLETHGVEGLVYRGTDVSASKSADHRVRLRTPPPREAVSDPLPQEASATLGDVHDPNVKASLRNLIRAVTDREARVR
ncbi:MAG: PAS domain-containing protein, partial [Pseudomonadota bacterium]